MYYEGITQVDDKQMHEFKYSYPLGLEGENPDDSKLLMYFQPETMELDRIIIKATSLNINEPFTIYATQPVTEAEFKEGDLDFEGVNCLQATETEQNKLNSYVTRIFELIMRTK